MTLYDCCCWCCCCSCLRCCCCCCNKAPSSSDQPAGQIHPAAREPVFEHKYVELKHKRRLHVVFCKGQQLQVVVVKEQPKPVSSTARDNAAFSAEPRETSKERVSDISVHVEPTSHHQPSSPQYNVINVNGLNYQDSKKSLGYLVIYRNKIEPAFFKHVAAPPPSLLPLVQQQQSSPPSDGNGDNGMPLLFFIHGVGGCARIWHHQMSYFAALGYDVCAVDLPGHGASASAGPPLDKDAFQFLRMAEQVLAVFDTYAKRRNVIIGHSYGY